MNDDSGDDKCLVFEFAFNQFTAVLSISEIDELICKQLVSKLKDVFDDVRVNVYTCGCPFLNLYK